MILISFLEWCFSTTLLISLLCVYFAANLFPYIFQRAFCAQKNSPTFIIWQKSRMLMWLSKSSFKQDENFILNEGNIYTIEPGVYLPGLGGIRIEDDILVTANGNENLTDLVPSDPKEIEALMA